MKKKMRLAKKVLAILASVVCTVLFLWFVVLGKVRAQQLLNPFLGKVPKNSEELKESGKNILGTAESAATSQNAQKVLEESANFFETSTLTEPIRQMRENIILKVSETIETIRDLPEREINTVKREVCKQWLGEDMPTGTPSGSP